MEKVDGYENGCLMSNDNLIIIGLIFDLVGTFFLALHILGQSRLNKTEEIGKQVFEVFSFRSLFKKKLKDYKDESLLDIPLNFAIDFFYALISLPFNISFKIKQRYNIDSAFAVTGLFFIFLGFALQLFHYL